MIYFRQIIKPSGLIGYMCERCVYELTKMAFFSTMFFMDERQKRIFFFEQKTEICIQKRWPHEQGHKYRSFTYFSGLLETNGVENAEKKSLNIDKLDCINKCGSTMCARNVLHVHFFWFSVSYHPFVAVFICRHVQYMLVCVFFCCHFVHLANLKIYMLF